MSRLVSVFLLGLRRRMGTWRAPAIALVIFAVMFTLSAVVIGPVLLPQNTPPANQRPDYSGDHV